MATKLRPARIVSLDEYRHRSPFKSHLPMQRFRTSLRLVNPDHETEWSEDDRIGLGPNAEPIDKPAV